MDTYNNLPLYVMNVDDTAEQQYGVTFVALVDRPAIKRGFLAFSEDVPKQMQFTISSEDRRIVSGPLFIPDNPVYREDEMGKYYVTMTAQSIERMVHKYFSQARQSSVNIMHDEQVDGVLLFESLISDKSRGVSPIRGYEDLPDGTWFGSFVVSNDEVWQSVKDGTFKGFSIEGMFGLIVPEQTKSEEEKMLDQITERLKKLLP